MSNLYIIEFLVESYAGSMVEESENDQERTPGRANKSSAKANRHTTY